MLDLFCGQGGAAYGIHKALPGYEIIGIDNKQQNRYPYTFIKGDALELALKYGPQAYLVWASPPCQAYTFANSHIRQYDQNKYVDLVKPTRQVLRKISRPYIMENVVEAPLRFRHSIILCGIMFGLKVYRHRRFETNPSVGDAYIQHQNHPPRSEGMFTVAGNHRGTQQQWGDAMGIDWMDRAGLRQAVPPVYAEYMVKLVLERLQNARQAYT